MRKLGYLLITLSFLAGSLVAVLEESTLNWGLFIPVLIGGFVGVALVQVGIRQRAQHVDTVTANIQAIHQSLESVVDKVKQLNRDKDRINTYDMRHKIDDMLIEDLNRFVEARESIGHKYGLQHYADVMSHFAAGERYLNRCWSASTDGYIDEVNAYMTKAEEQFLEAFTELQKLEAGRAA